MGPIYEPKGAAREYGELALNVYAGCPHRCPYCFAPSVLRRDRETFHSVVEPRADIVEKTRRQLEREHITGKTVHLCFTCDPYPTGYDSTPTREIIKLLKEHGNNVQVLTKGDGSRDFDLLNGEDWFGITISGGESYEKRYELIRQLGEAKRYGIKTWISFEPVIDALVVLDSLRDGAFGADKVKIGKLNYRESDINWGGFGRRAEQICKEQGLNYYIKDSLRQEMAKSGA